MHKVFYSLLLTIILSYNSSNGQWILQTSGTSNTLFDAYFLNADTGFIVGDNGIILTTIDAGNNWNQQFAPNTFVYLLCIHFPTNEVGYIGGQDGYIAKTTDGGLNFFDVTQPQSWDNISSILFLSEDIGFVTSLSGIYKTIDGANSWQLVSGWPIGDTEDLCFVNDSVGYSIGEYFQKTIDGGNNWVVMDTFTLNNPRSIFFTSKDTGYIAFGEPAILKTTDGGLSWNSLAIPVSSSPYVIYSITFTSSNEGFAVGGYYQDRAIILHTNDGGDSWVIQMEDSSLDMLTTIYFPNDSIGYTASAGGHVLKTDNGLSSTVEKFNNTSVLSVTPNPFSTSTTIQTRNLLSDATLSVYNSQGEPVQQINNLFGHTVVFNASNLPAGLYFFRLSQKNNILTTGKLIISKN